MNNSSTFISVRLTPKASSNRIGKMRDMEDGTRQLIVYVTSVPEDGKANDALIKILSKHYKIPASKIDIIKGHKNRNKLVKIEKHLKIE